MVFESIVAASIYSSAIAYLHYDGPPRTQASLEAQPKIEVTVAGSHESQDNRAHPAQTHDVDPADLNGESIWAKDDGKFDNWAK
tara:strand:- start:183 stop:434 length:252 start_codon:yes stop_codon:yes gene_type:complete